MSAIPYDRNVLVWTLVQHQRMDSRQCLCGWDDLGKSWAAHVADEYEKSDALRLMAGNTESLLDAAESTLLASGYTPNADLVDCSEWSARQVAEIVLTAIGTWQREVGR